MCISFVEAAPRAAAQGHDSHKLFFHTWRIQDALFQDNLIFMFYFSSLKIDHLLMQVHLVIDLRAMAWALAGWDFPAAASGSFRRSCCLRLLVAVGWPSRCIQWTMYQKIFEGSRWGIPRSFAHCLGMGENDFPSLGSDCIKVWLHESKDSMRQELHKPLSACVSFFSRGNCESWLGRSRTQSQPRA